MPFRSGFVCILGRPNAGKSTLAQRARRREAGDHFAQAADHAQPHSGRRPRSQAQRQGRRSDRAGRHSRSPQARQFSRPQDDGRGARGTGRLRPGAGDHGRHAQVRSARSVCARLAAAAQDEGISDPQQGRPDPREVETAAADRAIPQALRLRRSDSDFRAQAQRASTRCWRW